MESILEPILHSPLLPDYVEELTNYLRLENEKRLAFYEWLDEGVKVEFIDGENYYPFTCKGNTYHGFG